MSTLRERLAEATKQDKAFPLISTLFVFGAIFGGGMIFIALTAWVQLLIIMGLAIVVTCLYANWITRR